MDISTICFLLLLGLLPLSCPMEQSISPLEAQELSRASAQTTSETDGVHPTPGSPLPRSSEDSLSGKASGTNELACSLSPTSGTGAFSDKVNSPVEDDTIDTAPLAAKKRKVIVLDSAEEQGQDPETQPGKPIHQIQESLLVSSKKPSTKENVAVVPPFLGVAKDKASLYAAPSLPVNANANNPLGFFQPKPPTQRPTISEISQQLKLADELKARGLTMHPNTQEIPNPFSMRVISNQQHATGMKPLFSLQLGMALLAKVNALLSELEEMDDPYNVTLLPTLSQFCILPDFSAMSKHPISMTLKIYSRISNAKF
ncbi:hypothetical protein CROQUDRAFT_86024 [Cronartium quercuum f. sp. fusiforme G11]|uniref:Uncharacterized protein n=1 Tax=Cronartium quercuum f. sp. fusiforme G11 TaxID=708437 RepID=A0A9P6TI11_9BASI|nr:hypothetical protein CROQUDRAFT_86024 [Cronartium quercuum f. sp. fusiforme G11]